MLLEDIVPFKSKKQLADEKKDAEHKEKVAALKKINKEQKKGFEKLGHDLDVQDKRSKIHAVK